MINDPPLPPGALVGRYRKRGCAARDDVLFTISQLRDPDDNGDPVIEGW